MAIDTLPLLRELAADKIGMLSVGELCRRGHKERIDAAKAAKQIIILMEKHYGSLSSVLLLHDGFMALGIDSNV